MRQKNSKVVFPFKLRNQVLVLLLLIPLVIQYLVPIGSFANETLLHVAGFTQEANSDSGIPFSEAEIQAPPLSEPIDNNENTPLYEEQETQSTQVSNDQVIDNEGGFVPPESDMQIETQSEPELEEPGAVKQITLSNRHFGTAPDDFSVAYTVTIIGAEVKYTLNGGTLTDYSEAFSVTLKAGEDAELQIHSEQDATVTVQQDTVTGNSALLGEKTQSAQADGTVLTFIYTPKIAFLVYKNWVDNKDFDHTRPNDLALQLFMSDGVETPQLISAVPVQVDKTTSLNTWVYIYQLPQHNLEGVELHYTVKEDVVPEHYTVSYSTHEGAPMVVNTQITQFTAKVNWRDGENSHHTRPSVQDYGSSLEFYQGIDDKDYTLYPQEPLTVTESGNEWTVVVSQLPKYNPDGVPYSYKLVQKPLSLADGHSVASPDGVRYGTQYKNYVNSASLTLAAYHGGMITNTLEGSQGFLGHKVWLDDGAVPTKAARPAGKYQLYRYPNKPGRSYTSASPVPKMEFAIDTGATEGAQTPIDFGAYAIGKGMPLSRYDEDGFEYIYFAKEILITMMADIKRSLLITQASRAMISTCSMAASFKTCA